MTTGLFLTPGAARTAYQVGAVAALVDAGIDFDVVAGCSAGAPHAAFAATGQAHQLVELWSRWRTQDVVRPDWKEILRGRLRRARGLATNQPQKDTMLDPYLRDRPLLPGMRLRLTVVNLATGVQETLEYPGESMPLEEATRAAVSVPGVVPPHEWGGQQRVDGLVTDGFPLEELLLATGVSRAFVIGIAPRSGTPQRCGRFGAVLRALDWNQYHETVAGLAAVDETNTLTARWRAAHDATLAAAGADTETAARINEAFAAAGFPIARDAVEIISILPTREIRMLLTDYRPERSRRLIELGRADARTALAGLTSL